MYHHLSRNIRRLSNELRASSAFSTVHNKGSFDYVVVGAGSAGCVLANRLSASPRNSVLLIEAGGNDLYPWVHVPVGYLYTMNNPRTCWCYSTIAQEGLNGRVIKYPRGKLLGGSSSINGMIYQRGQHADYDSWARTCGEDWSWSEVRPFFEEHLDYRIDAFEGTTEINPDDKHSTGGEWRVENQRLSWEILDRFEQAAIDSGLPRNLHLNNSNFEGVGYFQVNQKRGIRLSSYRAFLKPVMDRPNLTVVTDSLCKRLVLEGNEVKGVEVWGTEGKPDMFYGAQKELILSAGSVGSSQLLEVSGIGAAEILAKAGVEMRHHLEGVGENLHDHLQIRSVFRLKDGTPSLNTMANSWTGNLKIGLEYMVNQSGPMSMAPSQMGIFAKSSQEFKTPNIQYHIQPLSLDGFGEPLHDFPGLTLSVCNLRPKSRGSVHIASPDSRTSPLIDPNYLSHPDDRKVAVDSLKHARRLASMAAMEELDPVEHFPGSEITTDAELALAAGRISTSIFHPVSTCKMGPATDKTAVVDPRLRVHGLKRLRVADGSVMPNITSGNTNSPILMIGEKASAMILEDNT